jgi:ubiquinol-cytochrome c reductase cytochrome b subunit
LRRLTAWLEERSGLGAALRWLFMLPIPGGAAWFRVLGAMAVFLLALEAATGVFLSFFYAPSAATAWASVAFIQDELTLGWFVRGLHSFGSTALIVVAALHFLQVIMWGAYRAPRELNWVVGLGLLVLVLVSAITGYALPWDQKGFWAKLVETGILGSTPVVGRTLEIVAQGGGGYGNYTVTHFHTVHVFLIPGALLVMLVAHLALVFRHRLTPHWSLSPAEISRRTEPYWPAQTFRDVVGALAAVAVVVGFVLYHQGPALEGPADPGSGYMARPEWYALPLYQLRMLFEGPLEIVATMVLPGLLAGVLVALPFLDRTPGRSPIRRWPVLAGTVIGLGAMVALAAAALLKDARDPAYQKHRQEVAAEAAQARALARRGVLPEGGLAVFKNDPAYETAALWKEKCGSCHPRTGAGGAEGPDLLDFGTRGWILAFLQDPQGRRFLAGAKKPERGGMQPVKAPPEELAALAEFVYSQSAAADVDHALAQRGKALFEGKNCDSCHETDGTSDARGPNLLGRGKLEYVRRIIQDSSAAVLFGERAKMPKFKGKLTPEEIDRLAQLVLGIEKS